ncbi:hypothetical protein V6N12_069765 [Hibiscus sabdariffa]|uniref:Uncharacterized protein n=1 Tax=Hibiscus sabdariffa TaxID=183260 RepID=A0ABR2FEX1_9ROSI
MSLLLHKKFDFSKMVQDEWNAPPRFRPCKAAPTSPAKPLWILRTLLSPSMPSTKSQLATFPALEPRMFK